MNYPDHIARSGKTIYDLVHDADDLYLPLSELETTLRNGLVGMSLDYPLRTRSKKLKSKICENWVSCSKVFSQDAATVSGTGLRHVCSEVQ